MTPRDARVTRVTHETVDIEIESLAFGGDGVGRQVGGDAEGRVTFVPLAAPGERVRVELLERKKRYARGELTNVLRPSALRIAPRCDLFGRCGGCQWQHVDRETQLEAKTDAVRRAVGDSALEVQPVGPAYGYRDRARMVVGRGPSGTPTLGFHARRSHEVVDVEACPLLSPALATVLPRVRAQVAAEPPGTEVALQAADSRVHAEVQRRSYRRAFSFDATDQSGARDEVHQPGLASLQIDLAAPGEPPLLIVAGAFAQVGRVANSALIETVMAQVGASGSAASGDRDPGRVLELYAGAGNFTRFLVQRSSDVTASDADGVALAAGASNVPAATWLAPGAVTNDRPFDTVVVDPPRAGLDEQAFRFAVRARRRLVYVSCDPQTFSRDCRRLGAAGLALTTVRALDLMPQTFHIELVASFEPREK